MVAAIVLDVGLTIAVETSRIQTRDVFEKARRFFRVPREQQHFLHPVPGRACLVA
jgi:hypothetical protein